MKKQILGEIISDDQAAPWMFAGGKDSKEADTKKYLFESYDYGYDEE